MAAERHDREHPPGVQRVQLHLRPGGRHRVRVDPSTITIGGVVVDPAQTYRVTTNNFVATGGDGFTVFTQCTNPLGGAVDIDALAEYFGANSPVAPGPQNRITRLN